MALRTFWLIRSGVSVRLMRLMSDGSDFDILAVPSRSDMIRAAAGGMIGSGKVNSSTAKSVLNLVAMSRASSRCCFWSSPTGTWVAW